MLVTHSVTSLTLQSFNLSFACHVGSLLVQRGINDCYLELLAAMC